MCSGAMPMPVSSTLKRRAVGAVAPDERDLAAGGRVADGVADQVAERARELGSEPRRSTRRLAPRARCGGVPPESAAASARSALEERLHVARAPPRGGGADSSTESVEQVLDDAVHARRLLAHHAEVVARRAAGRASARAPSRGSPTSTVSGVRSSCETLATKSRRMVSTRSACVTSRDEEQLLRLAVAG